ncbi:alpha/beta hydrolase, partial [Gorillibacterium massiliense]|uniref:alpha/beta hydrolase n=1 Tax=Gorillibacterium massiliense TaxID=1280390 RepID=UPI000592C33F
MSMYLWPEGAPFAAGSEAVDMPRLTEYPVERKAGEQHAAVVVLPGGGYQYLAEHEGEPVARWLNTLGIHAFVLDYRVAPYHHPVPLLDTQRAIRMVRHLAGDRGINAAQIGILGFSAGGHLASTAGTHFDYGHADSEDPIERCSSRPDAMILCYPVISFGEHRHHGSMVNLLGTEEPPEELRELLSNELQVRQDTPPTFLFHTAEDGLVTVENSLLFASALSRKKIPFDLHVYQAGHHGVGLAE